MLTRKCYKFLDKTYDNEKDYALALSQNYGDALNFIFTDEFLNSFKDSYLRGRVSAEIKRCKYVESALTMVIYLLNPSLGLCVRGKYFTSLKELAEFMYANSEEKTKTVIHLFKDHCITHTLGLKEDLSEKLKKDIVYVEDHIEDASIYEYFVSLFGVKFKQTSAHGLSVFDYFIYGVKNEKDRFQAYLNLLNDPSFKSSLYERYSIPEILKIYQQKDAPFAILKLLGEEVTVDIAPIVDSGINLWLCNNVKNYKFKGKANKVKDLLLEAKKHADKLTSLEEKIQFNERLYNVFRSFVNLYDAKLILARTEDYEFNYYYNSCRGCKAYYDSINLPVDDSFLFETPEYSKENKKKIIKHTTNELSQYLEKENNKDRENNAKPGKQYNRLKTYQKSFIFTLVLSLVAFGVLLYDVYIKSFSFENLFTNLSLCLSAFGVVYSLYGMSNFKNKVRVIEENFLDDEENYLLQRSKNTKLYRRGYKNILFKVLLNDLVYSALLLVLTFISLLYFNKIGFIEPYKYYLIGLPFVYVLLNIINCKFKLANLVIYLVVLALLVTACVLL